MFIGSPLMTIVAGMAVIDEKELITGVIGRKDEHSHLTTLHRRSNDQCTSWY
jgi:hypothetical protein